MNDFEVEKELINLRYNQLEQQTKLKNLRIYGIKESTNENPTVLVSDILKTKLGLHNMSLDECYRLGTPQEGSNRPILATFKSMQQRNLVFFNKKKFKGSKVVVTEDLTKNTYDLLMFAKENLGKQKTWTIGGKIMTKVDGKKIMIKSEEDVMKLIDINRG